MIRWDFTFHNLLIKKPNRLTTRNTYCSVIIESNLYDVNALFLAIETPGGGGGGGGIFYFKRFITRASLDNRD